MNLTGVLVVEDEARLARNFKTYLETAGHEVRIAATAAAALEEFDRFKPDVVLLDYKLPDGDGLTLLSQLLKRDANVKVIMVSGAGGLDVAVEAMKLGARDYVAKPVVMKELKLLIARVAREERMHGALQYFQRKEARDGGAAGLIGEAPAMRALKDTLGRIVQGDVRMVDATPATVLISGETGTGKELVARALHYDGPRRDAPFVELNCAAIPADLVESELFGYERGAFTSARDRKLGLVEAADGGSLFLDEVGELALSAQAKLLKVIEDRVVRRLGGLRDVRVDVRLIAATNRPLDEQVAAGRFREDLFYRLGVVELRLPPLRERGSDIVRLARHFLTEQGRRYGREGLAFTGDAEAMLTQHAWRGNVRELRNVVEQAVLLGDGPVIGVDALPLRPMPALQVSTLHEPADEPAFRPPGTAASTSNALVLPGEGLKLADVEQTFIRQALERTGGNVARAAELIGLSRDALRYRMEKFGLLAAGAQRRRRDSVD